MASLATAVDLAILLLLRLGPGVPVLVADAVSVAVASVVSYSAHRLVTFADDPERRWVHSTRLFLSVTAMALVVDVVTLRIAVAVLGSESAPPLLLGKVVSLGAAGVVRVIGVRHWLARAVRDERSRVAPAPLPPSPFRLSVVVPAFHEEGRIASTVSAIRSSLSELAPIEIVVVDDGSSDGTAAAARAGGADVVVVHPANRGKGAAVRSGVAASSGAVVAFTDADLSYPPPQLRRLVDEVERGWDVVVGSRKHIDTRTLVEGRRLRELSGRVFNLLTEVVLLGRYRDTQCGLKGFRGDVARELFPLTRVDGFAFDVELFHLAERHRLSLLEVPVELANSSASTVRVGRDSVRMVRDVFRIRRWAGQGAYDARRPGADART